MPIIISNQRPVQYPPPGSHIITDEAEAMKLLEQRCGYVKPWSMENKGEAPDKQKNAEPKKDYRKIDFYL